MRIIFGLLIIATALLGTRAVRADQLVNRDTAAVSEVSNVGEQEQLRRYFLQSWR